jgi:excisionase family DNA binding protein
MSQISTYTIAEAAALTGLHRNTIRMRIKLGQLEATVRPGKFGDEYRIAHAALVAAGLLAVEGPLGDAVSAPPDISRPEVFDAEVVDPDDEEPVPHDALGTGDLTPDAAANAGEPANEAAQLAALSELYQRHEHAMFRLGYLQGEMERLKALAETAESLRDEKEERAARVRELEAELARETERASDADRQRVEAERQREEAERLRRELSLAQERLQGMETLRADLDALKERVNKPRPRWRFW